MIKAGTLRHGGIMVNYQCNAACRHCGYACSPDRGEGYVTPEMAKKICGMLKHGGCYSVHIGGGEPFLNFDGLMVMVKELKTSGISLEYIETNAAWAGVSGPAKGAAEKLEALMEQGVDSLCISMDPYHAEYVPYGAPLNLAALCDKVGMGYFLWKREFLSTLSKLDPDKTYTREEMEKRLAKDYIFRTARQYGIGFGGRAANIEREYCELYPAEKFYAEKGGCERRMLNTGHFHVDLDGLYLGCTGLVIPLNEVADGIDENKYRVFAALHSGGPGALLPLAKEAGFTEDPAGYPSRCNLCLHMRAHLAQKGGYPDLDPRHYREAFRHY